jgi:tRNA modification GTPase
MSFVLDSDTICAIATPPGKSGIGVVRISGPLSRQIGERILGFIPTPRHAHYCSFNDRDNCVLDVGIALFFSGPHSFTGEDILELQGHGGYFVLDALLKEILAHGARMARPGEFSERAFLNGKMDLTQVEAIADLIESSSTQAARSAIRSLQGEFSRLVRELSESIVALRVFIEAAIDFSDEEIDFLTEGNTLAKLSAITCTLESIFSKARQGTLLQEGMSVVIAGKPNAGKSSLLNTLAEKEAAIVTDIAGTTRDILKEQLNIDGMPLHVTDTAGLRESSDPVEQEGIRRALDAIDKADRILLVVDSRNDTLNTSRLHEYLAQMGPFFKEKSLDLARVTIIHNKIDLQQQSPRMEIESMAGGQQLVSIHLSAKNGEGISLLQEHLKQCMGYQSSDEGSFTARRRHLEALDSTRKHLESAWQQLSAGVAPELVAEDLRLAHVSLGEITGEFTADDLLGRIFSSFCIGK